MSGTVPARIAWAVERLAIGPSDRLLEIGCGTGVAVELVCARLRDGHVTAIDRSPAMLERAERQNAPHVAAGRASFECAALAAARIPLVRFDRIFAVNVNLFWTGRAPELAALRAALVPGGTLHLFYQPPSAGKIPRMVDAIAANLRASGFAAPEVTVEERLAGGPGVEIRSASE